MLSLDTRQQKTTTVRTALAYWKPGKYNQENTAGKKEHPRPKACRKRGEVNLKWPTKTHWTIVKRAGNLHESDFLRRHPTIFFRQLYPQARGRSVDCSLLLCHVGTEPRLLHLLPQQPSLTKPPAAQGLFSNKALSPPFPSASLSRSPSLPPSRSRSLSLLLLLLPKGKEEGMQAPPPGAKPSPASAVQSLLGETLPCWRVPLLVGRNCTWVSLDMHQRLPPLGFFALSLSLSLSLCIP